MTKFLALALLVVASPTAFAGKKSDKFVISYQTGNAAEDCKISIKEIENLPNKKENKRNVCIYADPTSTEEMTPARLGKLLNDANVKVSFSYEGTGGTSLIGTLDAWLQFLVGAKKDAAGWTVSLGAVSASEALVDFASAKGEKFSVKVALGVELKKEEE